MIIRNEDRQVKVIKKLRDGMGEINLTSFCDDKALPPKCKLAALLTIEKGSSIGPHSHDGDTEFYYVISGEGKTIEDSEIKHIKEGDVTITGGGASHYLEGTSEEPLKVIAMVLYDE